MNAGSVFKPGSWRRWIGPLAVLALGFVLIYPIFKVYLTQPNSKIYAYSGDALVLYYNTEFHARYDNDAMLRNMNYPDGEYIYLTDAQGAVSNLCQWIHRHVTDLSNRTPGVIHSINLTSVFAAMLLMYALLRALDVQVFNAVLFAPLVIMLSPQFRRVGGHFGLGYPFLIPLAMLWFLRKYRVGKFEKRDLLVLGISVFFTFNNPYTGFNINFFLILAGLLLWIFEDRKTKNWRRPAIISLMGAVPLLWVFADLHLLDNVTDRLSPQWGFFFYHASFEGLFHPPMSVLYDWLTRNKVAVPPVEFEAMLNVGIVTTLALLAMVLMTIFGRFSGKNRPTWHKLTTAHRIIILSAFCLFLLAANTSIIPVSEDWLEDHMGWMLMFKASGRLGWAFYFALTVTGVVFIDRLYRLTSPWFMAGIFSIVMAVLWHSEINQYVKPNMADIFHDNFFGKKFEKEMLDVIEQNGIKTDEFQAMLGLPKMMAWSDKIHSDIHFNTQFNSMRMSVATGIPMINGMLSRIGLKHSMERVQMLSDPLIDREMLSKFPNQKDILLLLGLDHPPLTPGEQFLISISKELARTPTYALYRLKLADIQTQVAAHQQAALDQMDKTPSPLLHQGYDEQEAPIKFYGKGSRIVSPEKDVVVEYTSPFERDTQLVFSAWTYIDARKWGSGYWEFRTYDPAGQEREVTTFTTGKSNEVDGNWLKAQQTVKLPKGGKLIVKAKHKHDQLIDEVMLWPLGANAAVNNAEENTFLFNGFKVRKQADR